MVTHVSGLSPVRIDNSALNNNESFLPNLGDDSDEGIDPFDFFTIAEPSKPQGGAKHIWTCDQAENRGPVVIDKVNRVIDQLNSSRTSGIRFNAGAAKECLDGGTCSAMSLGLINDILKAESASPTLSKSKKDLKATIGKAIESYRSSSPEFRNTQMAFNTIMHEESEEPNEDLKLARMASLAAFYERKIVKTSEEFDISNTREEKIVTIIQELPEGIYALRAIKPENNHKGEAYGHSMVLIKGRAAQFFYDPNNGVYKLKKGDEGNSLIQHLRSSHNRWTTPDHRFYQIV